MLTAGVKYSKAMGIEFVLESAEVGKDISFYEIESLA